ncbi:MAG: hypothetical protein OEY55_14950 [Acidimicrobiia bacterium]|nr:hypothetical protein [Acidimicrobiia bacterium]MDH5504293.1 hypothetical protein [Acidimicrobiia bacterium]
MEARGEAEPAKETPKMLGLASLVQPKLRQDGVFLVGSDIAGDKLLEANVFGSGGLGSAKSLSGVDFAGLVIADLERKLELRMSYGSAIDNVAMATLLTLYR